MLAITLEEFQRNLHHYLQQVETGEVLILSHHNAPIAEVKPIASDRVEQRPIGLCRGDFSVPDSFNDPLPDTLISDFE